MKGLATHLILAMVKILLIFLPNNRLPFHLKHDYHLETHCILFYLINDKLLNRLRSQFLVPKGIFFCSVNVAVPIEHAAEPVHAHEWIVSFI